MTLYGYARVLVREPEDKNLDPHDPQAAPIVVAFTEFPGLRLRFGSWRTEPFPDCGCDACDETADVSIEEMTRMVEAVVSGRFREAMRVPPLLGDGWQESEFRFDDGHGGFSRSRGRVPRSRALEMTGGGNNPSTDLPRSSAKFTVTIPIMPSKVIANIRD